MRGIKDFESAVAAASSRIVRQAVETRKGATNEWITEVVLGAHEALTFTSFDMTTLTCLDSACYGFSLPRTPCWPIFTKMRGATCDAKRSSG